MAVQVQMPTQPREPQQKARQPSTLDKILQAVQVANGTFGIAADVYKIKSYYDLKPLGEAKTAAALKDNIIKDKQIAALDAGTAKQSRLDKGELTPLELSKELATNKLEMVKNPDEANFTYNLRTEQGLVPIYARLKPDMKDKVDASNIKKNEAAANFYAKKGNTLGNMLPVGDKEEIVALKKENVNREQIRNSINSQLVQMQAPGMKDDEITKIGQSLLKTLNSEIGKDAIGAEESKRLGSFLDKKFFNITEPGSVFGRDLDLFIEQAARKSDSITEGINANNSRVAQIRGKQAGENGQPVTTQLDQAKKFNKSKSIFQLDSPAIEEAVANPNIKFNPDRPVKVIK